jgi:hypothetical protein
MPNFPAPKRVTKTDFGQQEFETLLFYIRDKLKYLKARTAGLRDTLIPKWHRIYHATPAEQVATWPWPGASNLVIPIAGTYSDELLSRVMASIYQNDPLFVAKILGDFDNDDNEMGGEAQRDMLQDFLQDYSYEPEELDLYRVEEAGFSSAIRYGTTAFKFPWEYVVEKQYIYVGGGSDEASQASYQPQDYIRRDGPHPAMIPLQDWMVDPKFSNLEEADFKAHTLHFNYYQLIALKAHPEIYDPDCIDKIIRNPDPISEVQRQVEEKREMIPYDEGDMQKNFDLEECWFTYYKDGICYRLLAHYHIQSETCTGVFFNPYPDNIEPFEDAKLAYDDTEYYGYGFCEMSEAFQREVSTTHNLRINNRHFATTGVGRVNKDSKLSSIMELFPGVLIPADKDEIEALNFGQFAMSHDTEDEKWTIQLATARLGVDPAVGGTGGGIVNSKRGIYSAQGTSVAMQQSNNRNNLRSSDCKSCHVRIGRKLLKLYSHFGLGNKIKKYGDRAELLKKAFESYKNGKLGLVIKPSTASINRELEKQNDILLSSVQEKLNQWQATVVQAIVNQSCPPELKELFIEQMKAVNYLFKHIYRNFGHDDASRMIPTPSFLKEERKNATTNSVRSIGGGTPPQQGQPPQVVPTAGGDSVSTIPTGAVQ